MSDGDLDPATLDDLLRTIRVQNIHLEQLKRYAAWIALASAILVVIALVLVFGGVTLEVKATR